MEHSIQGQLLAAGNCVAGRCASGSVGYVCSTDSDCGLYSRVHEIKLGRSKKTRSQFYASLMQDILDQAVCVP